MKRFFALLVLAMFATAAFPQQTWLKGSGTVSLYSPTDKVGLGTNVNLNDKLTIQSLGGETPLAIRGYAAQSNPFIKISGSSGAVYWRLFAARDWWLIGSTFDSTTAIMSVKPSSSWILFNGTGKFSKVISTSATLTGATPLTFTGTAITTGIDFSNLKMPGTSSNNALIDMGTWTNPLYVIGHTAHTVPLQVNLHVSSSAAYDVAAARFRVDSDADTACTSTYLNVLELRSSINSNVGSHANLNASTSIGGNTTCVGDFIGVVAKLEGSGNVTCSNHVLPFHATNVATGTGIDGVGLFENNTAATDVADVLKASNISSGTVTNLVKAEISAGTATTAVDITRSGGTLTNGVKMTGAITKGIDMSGVSGTSAIALVLPNSSCDTTGTAVKGAIVFKTSDSTIYVCRSTLAAKKWYSMLP